MNVDEAIAKVKGVSAFLTVLGEKKDFEYQYMDFGFGLLADDLRAAVEVVESYVEGADDKAAEGQADN